MKKIAMLQGTGEIKVEKGKAYDYGVAHDKWCLVYAGGECNCDPTITVTEITKDNREQVSKHIDEETAKFKEQIKKKIV